MSITVSGVPQLVDQLRSVGTKLRTMSIQRVFSPYRQVTVFTENPRQLSGFNSEG